MLGVRDMMSIIMSLYIRQDETSMMPHTVTFTDRHAVSVSVSESVSQSHYHIV